MSQSELSGRRAVMQAGAGAAAVLLIMFIGSFVLWIGTPLFWLWVGSQIEGSGGSLGAALAVMFLGVVVTIAALASLLVWLSSTLRTLRVARGLPDPGNVVLEGVLVVSAGLTIVTFGVWFLFFAGASPIPIGISI